MRILVLFMLLIIVGCKGNESDKNDFLLLKIVNRVDSLNQVVNDLKDVIKVKNNIIDTLNNKFVRKFKKLEENPVGKDFSDEQVIKAFKKRFEFLNRDQNRINFEVISDGNNTYSVSYYIQQRLFYAGEVHWGDYRQIVYVVKLNKEGTDLINYKSYGVGETQ